MRYKNLCFGFEFLISLLVISQLVNAFGVTTHYWNEKPLIMYPGQTKNVDVVLQNMVGNEDVRLKAEITSGSEIATLIDPHVEYLVPLGRKDVKVNIRVTIPENVPLKSKYDIGVSFKQVAEEEGKMVQIAGAVGTSIPVVIKSVSEVPVEKKETETKEESQVSSSTLLLLVLAVIIIVIIAYTIFRKKK